VGGEGLPANSMLKWWATTSKKGVSSWGKKRAAERQGWGTAMYELGERSQLGAGPKESKALCPAGGNQPAEQFRLSEESSQAVCRGGGEKNEGIRGGKVLDATMKKNKVRQVAGNKKVKRRSAGPSGGAVHGRRKVLDGGGGETVKLL